MGVKIELNKSEVATIILALIERKNKFRDSFKTAKTKAHKEHYKLEYDTNLKLLEFFENINEK